MPLRDDGCGVARQTKATNTTRTTLKHNNHGPRISATFDSIQTTGHGIMDPSGQLHAHPRVRNAIYDDMRERVVGQRGAGQRMRWRAFRLMREDAVLPGMFFIVPSVCRLFGCFLRCFLHLFDFLIFRSSLIYLLGFIGHSLLPRSSRPLVHRNSIDWRPIKVAQQKDGEGNKRQIYHKHKRRKGQGGPAHRWTLNFDFDHHFRL